MITDDNKKLAQWAMEYALKNGCQAAKLVLYTNSNSSFELRDGKMDRLQQSTENGLGLNLYVDGRFGSFSTNRLDKKELETLITNGIESTRYLAVDESRMLADPARYYKGGKPDLQLFDNSMKSTRMIKWRLPVLLQRRYWARMSVSFRLILLIVMVRVLPIV